MRLLALDTATEAMAVGLVDGDSQVAVNTEGGAQASDRLIPVALELLAQRGLAPAALNAVAFGQGPGAFTGLRTAVSVAQGLAFGIGCPVLPIDSLLIVAEDARAQALGADTDEPFSVWVAMDARMDESYAASYRHDGRSWTVIDAPALYDLPSLAARWSLQGSLSHLAGTAVGAFTGRLPWGNARLWPQAADRAAALLRLARAAWLAGRGVPARQALPIYLRDKVALTTAERLAAKAAAAQGDGGTR
ncbi:tRNA (adenosine(37)-N6)-threonylcarbamoyltransferase complex dimerization subunit type 1 TsaB [Ideonella sp. DXS29W]|uniref:tRNA (Adenosine(37)-N6)-threonylcarbamoyltransferase complex dimerization subunit type 1 TsaB n=1 Tax=Ideonella lacteola TaxID=2984193 RepID=A0ABU9BR18_9BURK